MNDPRTRKDEPTQNTAQMQQEEQTASDAPTQQEEQSIADALTLLETDHLLVRRLFEKFRDADEAEKEGIVAEACDALTAHMAVEEELLYPEARIVLEEQRQLQVEESYVEHFLVKSLIENLKGMQSGQQGFEAAVKVLMEQVEHHVDEEESELFPSLRESAIDLTGLGQRISARKAELQGQD